MLRAWYGITPTGVQADYAIVKLAELCALEYPVAKECPDRDRYVNDIPTVFSKTHYNEWRETL